MIRTAKHALIALAGVLAAAACSTDITDASPQTTAVGEFTADGMRFTASASVSGSRTLALRVLVENISETARQTTILGGNCMIMARLYHASNGTTAWSQYDRTPACQEPALQISLEPGETETLEASTPVEVGRGTYFTTATIQYLGGFPTPYVELIAGNVTFD